MNSSILLYDKHHHIQYVSNGNKKLLVYIKNGPEPEIDTYQYDNSIDLYVKTIIKLRFDVVYIRATRLFDMYDIPCEDGMNKIKDICSQYESVDGVFVCGGAVLGLYYSNMLPYNKIYCISPRFLDGMTMSDDRVKHFKYQNNKVTKEHLNQNSEYIVVYNPNEYEGFDVIAANWIKENTIKSKHILFQQEGNEKHLMENAIGIRNYIETFLPNLFSSNLQDVPNFYLQN